MKKSVTGIVVWVLLLLFTVSWAFAEQAKIETTEDGRVVVFDEAGKVVREFQLEDRPVRTTFMMTGKQRLFAVQGQQSSLLNVQTGEVESTYHGAVVIGISADENQVVTFDTSGAMGVSLRSINAFDSPLILEDELYPRYLPTLAIFSPDNRFVAVYFRPGYHWSDDTWGTHFRGNLRGSYTRLYELPEGSLVPEFLEDKASFWPLPGRFTEDGQFFISGRGDRFSLTSFQWFPSEQEEDQR